MFFVFVLKDDDEITAAATNTNAALASETKAEVKPEVAPETQEEVNELTLRVRNPSASALRSRLTPDMNRLRMRRASHSAAKRKSARLRINMAASASTSSSAATTPRSCQASPSPRPGSALFRTIEPLHPLAPRGRSEIFEVSPRQRQGLQASTTCSLDVVDLWEETTDTETEGEFQSGETLGVSSTSTCDVMQELRLAKPSSNLQQIGTYGGCDVTLSQSPVACKRNKLNIPRTGVQNREEKQLKPVRDNSKSRLPVRVRSRLRKRVSLRKTRGVKTTPPSTPSSPEQGQKVTVSGVNLMSKSGKLFGEHLPKVDVKTLATPGLTETKPHAEETEINLLPTSAVIGSNRPRLDDFTDLHVDTADHGDQHLTSTGQGRRVKFNSFVRVRQNDANTLEFLKRSSDTARSIKNKYLRVTSARSSGMTSDRLLHTIH